MLSKGIKRYQVEKCIRGRICNVVYRFVKANNKYIKDYDKNKESSYLKYWDVNNLYGWAMSQKLPLYDFMRVEKTSQFNEDFIKICNENLLKMMFNILKNCMNFIMIYTFCLKKK